MAEKIYDSARTEVASRRPGARYKCTTVNGANAYVELNPAENAQRDKDEADHVARKNQPPVPTSEERIAALEARIAALEARGGNPSTPSLTR